jgi:hypothetical protein
MVRFDPYHRWLGIRPEEQPASYYRLLGLAPFEDDREVIRDAAFRQIAHVRKYSLGEHTDLAQQVLNELARAQFCLLDVAKKAEYDSMLRRAASPVAPSDPADIYQLAEKPPDRPPLLRAPLTPSATSTADIAPAQRGPSILGTISATGGLPRWMIPVALGVASVGVLAMVVVAIRASSSSEATGHIPAVGAHFAAAQATAAIPASALPPAPPPPAPPTLPTPASTQPAETTSVVLPVPQPPASATTEPAAPPEPVATSDLPAPEAADTAVPFSDTDEPPPIARPGLIELPSGGSFDVAEFDRARSEVAQTVATLLESPNFLDRLKPARQVERFLIARKNGLPLVLVARFPTGQIKGIAGWRAEKPDQMIVGCHPSGASAGSAGAEMIVPALYVPLADGRTNGWLRAWNSDGTKRYGCQNQRGRRSGLACCFEQDQPRAVVEYKNDRIATVHLVANGLVAKSFANEDLARKDETGAAVLANMEHCAKELKDEEMALRKEVAKKHDGLARMIAGAAAAAGRAETLERIDQRGAAQLEGVQNLQRLFRGQ